MTRVVYVISKGSANKFDCVNKLSSLSRVNEMDLICAVLSGNLDPSVLISPCGRYWHADKVSLFAVY